MRRLPNLHYLSKRIAYTLVRRSPKPMVVKESLLFEMAKIQSMEDEQERLTREVLRRIQYIPVPECAVVMRC